MEGGNPRNPGKACGGSEKMILYSMSEVLDFEKRKGKRSMETVYMAGGCLWGVQHFFDSLPGVQMTEAGRANGQSLSPLQI